MKNGILAMIIAAAALRTPGAEPMSAYPETIPLGSSVYRDMDALCLAAGAGTPSNARPWTKDEARMILSRVDRNALGGALQRLRDAIAAELEPGPRFRLGDGSGFGVGLDINAEGYGHANVEDFALDTDWAYGFEQRAPLARLALDFSVMDFLYVYCDLQYGRNRTSSLDEVSLMPEAGVGAIVPPRADGSSDAADGRERGIYVTRSDIYGRAFLTNFFAESYDFDFEWPKRAVASVGGANWNVSLARDRVSWGNGHSGNFIVDDHVDFQDYARAVAYTDRFKYDWLTVFFPVDPGRGETADDGFRVLMAHRLEFRVLERLTLALSEDVMYRNDVFDARYLNPAFIYHNLNNRAMFNAIAHAELDFAAGAGFNLYAQYVLDQARAPNESAAQADAMGWLAGVEHAAAAGPGVVSGALEIALTTPLLYRRDGVDFLMFRRYFTHGDPGLAYVDHFDYIGYQYGGDAQVLLLELEYRVPGSAELGFRAMGMRHGEMGFFTSHNMAGDNGQLADYQGSTPSGDAVAESLEIGLSGRCPLPRFAAWADASVWARADWIGKRTYIKADASYTGAKADLQVSMGLTLSL